MNFDQFRTQNSSTWNQVILNFFWIILLLYMLGQLLFMTVSVYTNNTTFEWYRFIVQIMLIPNSVLAVLVLLSRYALRKWPGRAELILIIASGLIAYSIYFSVSPNVQGKQIVLLLPIFISMVYFHQTYLTVCGTVNIALYTVLFWGVELGRGHTSISEYITSVTSFVVAFIIAAIVIKRVKSLWRMLEQSKQAEQELMIRSILLDKMTKIDALTGMYNHKTFHEYMEKLIDHSQRHDVPLHLCIMDIDNFKQVNDTYGHQAGDKVLKLVGETVHSMVTPNDIVSRYGGEEFAVIFIGRPLEECIRNVNDILKIIATTPIEDLGGSSVTVSAGMSSLQEDERKDKLFERVDALLYRAKRSGKNNLITE